MILNKLTVQGYKSIQTLENFELHNLNIFIGANGAGKSNFINLFKLLAAIARSDLQFFVQEQGGPNSLLYGGKKRTSDIKLELHFGSNDYQATLSTTVDNRLIFKSEEARSPREDYHQPYIKDDRLRFKSEEARFQGEGYHQPYIEDLGSAHEETRLAEIQTGVCDFVLDALNSWRVYHFHDTSQSAHVKNKHGSNDNQRLHPDAGNLAAYIARLKNEYRNEYRRIIEVIQLAAPFFKDFVIRDPLPDMIELEWLERNGDPDTPYRAHMLSDGTLRFICLTTLLMQPIQLLPDTILIDEPELGLHPYAINLLADMLKQVSEQKQVIVSTQSVELLNAFTPEDIIIVENQNGASKFQRLNSENLKEWLDDYTLGDLWKSNVLGGRPS